MAGGWFTTNTDADDVLTTWINKQFVTDLMWDVQYQKFTTKAVIPDGGGNIGRFVTFAPPTATTGYALGSAALTEGNTGSEHEITSIATAATNCTIGEFGEWYRLGKLASKAEAAGTAQRIQKRMNDGAALAVDSYIRGFALDSTNYVYATLAAPGAIATAPATVGDIGAGALIFCGARMKSKYCQPLKGIEGHPDGHFAAVITPNAEMDVVTEVSTTKVTWSEAVTNVGGKMGQDKWVNGYIGSIYGTAVYVTQNHTTTTLTSVVELSYVLSDGGLGAMSFGDMNPQIIFNDVNSPYKNVKSIAWYTLMGAGLIHSDRVIKLYHLA